VSRPVLVALALLAASPARAGPSPRWGSIDIGAQTYRPNIDAEFAGAAAPYEEIFGSGRGWMFQLGFSRALYTRAGSLELGVRTGWFEDTGRGLQSDGGTPPVYTPSGDETKLKIIPTSLALSYRFDMLADRWNVPFAPYGRVAFERYNWWVTDGSGGSVEQGATNGWSVTGGLGFLLDFVDPQLARELDLDAGVNHTFLFFEVTRSTIDDFGSSTSWDLSDEKLSLGMGLLFVF
jgi:hypothetical protein